MLRCARIFFAISALLWSVPASALLITLSDESSTERMNDPGYVDNVYLDATLDFSVSGSTLTLTVTNLTSGDFLFDINEIGFNTTDNITGLSLTSAPAGWTLSASTGLSSSPTHLDGFGIFDWALFGGVGPGAAQIAPSASVMFELAIMGTGPFDMNDFFDLSGQTPTGDNTLSYAVAKFVSGRDSMGNPITDYGYQDSSFGAAVPEPGTGLLVAIGLAGLAGFRRR